MNFLSVFLIAAAVQQPADSTAYLDRDARVLVASARAARLSLDKSIRAYTGIVKQRVGVALRTPLKDRTLYRHESAAQIRWSRDDAIVIKVLGARQFHPGSSYDRHNFTDFGFDQFFDPTMDRLYFGMTRADDDEVWIEHPLLDGSEARYRFKTGDTITISFPDGRRVQVVELRILPRSNHPKLVTGSVWIEPGTGAIVKAAYRMAGTLNLMRDTDVFDDDDDLEDVPGLFKPFEIDVTMISIEYSYWRLRHWLPRSMRMEGTARAGIVTAPAALDIAYDIHEVFDDADSVANDSTARAVMRAWRDEGEGVNRVLNRRQNGQRLYVVVPEDPTVLAHSPDLPPPVWESSPDFITEKELRKMYGGLADLPLPPSGGAIGSVDWGLQRGGLVRYNRVEGLSLGVRAETTRGAHTLWATPRIGVADLAPNLELGAERETLRRTLTATVSHGLTAIDARSLGLGASVSALLLGRDDGDYYRSTGARLSVSPPSSQPEWYRFSLFAERQRAVDRATNWSLPRLLDSSSDFRPNLQADVADLGGAELILKQWWGSDPRGWQAGLEFNTEAATGDFEYARAALTARTAFPIAQKLRGALEAGAGTSEGGLPAQKQFFLGGAHTLRGYAGSALVGPSFARARAELAYTRPEVGLALFTDAGWAGDRNSFYADDALLSAGVGVTILDGLIRIDLARALRRPLGWRLELHLDSVL